MSRALVLGGTGVIGRAVAGQLLADGWTVHVTGRDEARVPSGLVDAGVRFSSVERDDEAGLREALGSGVDLLVDCLCFTAAHARSLIPLARHANSTVMMSSRAVYIDGDGNHVNSAVAPRFDGPVTEQQPTVAPGSMPYDSPEGYGPNKVAAERTLLDSGLPVTVLRPPRVHGPGASSPREWYFLKRALDRRPAVLLAGRGADHSSAAVNIGALVALVADRPGRRILNAADPDAPDVLSISRIIAAAAGHSWREVLLGDDAPAGLGRHPWHRVPPIVLDLSAAYALGYRPAGDYATTVQEELRWLMSSPPRAAGPADFDYAAEDAYLRSR
ncbi:NAD-dependent epimerase/dehydratase family protein [Amycolatopsis magusensis]|uniref:NAD-dependent epimerase/dehydratase family protein n=1 Tax=Amycolatopsis magusensis TaxID=882444 RepID=UPI0024A8511F|nr:NAD-dependent epimerase/dehydratase family protein [Amycolatopsis magusensis]MDI5981124.1 NAD(P)H-binding protein [Amycolatopsis magusensis]